MSEVSRICKELDDVVQTFKDRPLEGEYPYVWLDATFPKRVTLGTPLPTFLVSQQDLCEKHLHIRI
jgi:hypothetical protein